MRLGGQMKLAGVTARKVWGTGKERLDLRASPSMRTRITLPRILSDRRVLAS